MYYNTGIFVNQILSTAKKHITSPRLYSFHADERQNFFLETFMRSWKYFWMEYKSRSNPFNKELFWGLETGDFVFEMFPKNPKENVEEENVEEENTAKVILKFFFRSNSSFEVTVDVSASTEVLHQKYLQAANKILDDISLDFILRYEETHFLRDWFETLHAHEMSQLTGKEAVWIYKIHNNAVKHFPVYRRMPLHKQINLLQSGALRALRCDHKLRDIHVFAKSCFKEIKAANAANSFIAPTTKQYNKIASHNQGELSFGDYLYEEAGLLFRTSIHDFDLWNTLCSSSTEHLAEI